MPYVTFKLETPEFEIPEKDLNRMRGKGSRAAITWFKEKRLDKRFTGGVASQLGWKKRSFKYNRAKGFKPPHVKTGETQRKAMAAKARGGPKRMSVRINGLNAGYRRVNNANRPPLAKELQMFTRTEHQVMAKIFASVMAAEIQKWLKRKKRRVRIR